MTPMTRSEYLDAIAKLGLSQVGAGRALGISRRQAQRLASGESHISGPIEQLVQSWLTNGLDEKTLASVRKPR